MKDFLLKLEHHKNFAFVFTLAILFFSSTVFALELTPEERDWLKKHPVIPVCSDRAWLPVESRESDGNFIGMAQDYLHLIEAKLHVRFEPANLSWSDAMARLKEGKLFMASAITSLPERDTYLSYTPVHTIMNIVVFGGPKIEYINQISELEHYQIAAPRGYASTLKLKKDHPHFSILEVDGVEEGLKKVAKGQADVFIDTSLSIQYNIFKLGLPEIRMIGPTPYSYDLRMGVHKNYPLLLSALTKALGEISEAEKNQIRKKWIFWDAHPLTFFDILKKALPYLFIPFILVSIWIYTLRKSIRKKTIEIQNSELLKKQIFDNSILPMILMDTDNNQCVDCNQAAIEIYQFPSREAVIGKTARDVSAAYQYDGTPSPIKAQEYINKAKKEGKVIFEWRHKRPNGEEWDSEVHLMALNFGKKTIMFFIVNDITEKKAAERALKDSNEKFTKVFNDAPMWVSISDFRTGKYLEVNEQGLRYSGFTREEVIGHTSLEIQILSPENRKKLLEGIAKDNRVSNLEIDFRAKDGTILHCLLNGEKLVFSGQACLLTVIVNITERKMMENELIRANRELQEATFVANLASLAKAEFIANLSHEIRTPLNSILGFTDYLLETSKGEEELGYLSRIKKSGINLLSLINNVLELSKIDAKMASLQKEDFALESMVDDTLEMVREKAIKKNIRLESLMAPELKGIFIHEDRLKLQRVLLNLLTNAVKFTNQGEVKLTLKIQDKTLVAQIQDSGIGIPKEKFSLLFKRFSQIDATSSKKEQGSGLGLSICKEIIELMGGTIEARSQIGKGSLFIFKIPLTLAQLKRSENTDQEIIEAPQYLKILLADDSEENRDLIKLYLKKTNCLLDFAINGKEALELFKKNLYDVVLMDIQMPELDGYEATRRIRSWEKENAKKETPVIALTGYALKEEQDKCFEAGCSKHMAKPIVKKDLFKMLSQFESPNLKT